MISIEFINNINSDSIQNPPIMRINYNYNLNPDLLIIPIIKITNKDKNFIFTAEFNLPSWIHKKNYVREVCLLYLLIQIYELENPINIGVIKLAEKIIEDDFIWILKIFRELPLFMHTINININEKHEKIILDTYNNIGIWLEFWHYKRNTRELKNSDINWLEKEAFLTFKRYELIYELYNLGHLDWNHNVIWLLTEISILLNKIESQISSLNQLYTNCKNNIDMFDNFGENPPTYTILLERDLRHLEQYIKTIGREVAEKNPEFDTHFYKPYLKAAKSANSYAKKNLKLEHVVEPSKKRPGGKIGHRKKKRH